jgi:hypothetical protein
MSLFSGASAQTLSILAVCSGYRFNKSSTNSTTTGDGDECGASCSFSILAEKSGELGISPRIGSQQKKFALKSLSSFLAAHDIISLPKTDDTFG